MPLPGSYFNLLRADVPLKCPFEKEKGPTEETGYVLEASGNAAQLRRLGVDKQKR